MCQNDDTSPGAGIRDVRNQTRHEAEQRSWDRRQAANRRHEAAERSRRRKSQGFF